MKTIRWLKDRVSRAWYGLGAWLTVMAWAAEEDPHQSMYASLLDTNHEHVLPDPVLYHSPDRPAYPDPHLEVFRIRQSDPTECTRHRGHDGPCNGYPRGTCLVFNDNVGIAVPLHDHPAVNAFYAATFSDDGFTGDLDEVVGVADSPDNEPRARRKKRSMAKKRKSTKALTPKRKVKAGKKTVSRKKRT